MSVRRTGKHGWQVRVYTGIVDGELVLRVWTRESLSWGGGEPHGHQVREPDRYTISIYLGQVDGVEQ